MYLTGITKKVYPHAGGGDSEGGGESGGDSSGGESEGGGGKDSGTSSGVEGESVSGLQNNMNSVSSYNNGDSQISNISSGLFSERTVGGGTRNQVYGNNQYGSGYPGVASNGVEGRGFPFYFWLLAWGEGFGYGSAANLHVNEYGNSGNSSRPGGPMSQSTFMSNADNTTFYVIADSATTISLVESIQYNCSSLISNTTSAIPIPYNSSDHSSPQPERVVQYYRASSTALLLQGYNNTADLTDVQNQTNTPLPSSINMTMLLCLNETIGAAVPIVDAVTMVDGAVGLNLASRSDALGLVWVLWCLSTLI